MMTVIAVALVLIALCQMAWLIGAAVRVRALMEKAEPLIAKTNELAEHVNRIAARVEDMAEVARRVEGRVAGTADQVLDQIEPPIRTLAAVVAGVRAGVGHLFEKRSRPHHDGRNDSPSAPTLTGRV